MVRNLLRKKAKKIAAALSSMVLLGVCPFAPASPAEAVTIVHDRPHQRGSGEFYRNTDPGHRPFSDRYGESLPEEEPDTGALIPGSNPAPEGEEQTAEAVQEPAVQEPVKTEPQPEETPQENQEVTVTAPETEAPAEKESRKEKKKKAKAAKAEEAAAKAAKEEEMSLLTKIEAAVEALKKPAAVSDQPKQPEPPKRIAAVAKPQEMTPWPMKTQDIGGTLLLSDNPEYVEKTGIYYTEQVKGDVRALNYQVNSTKRNLRTAIVLENKGESHAVVHVNRVGISEPSSDYLAVGKATQLAYFGKQTARVFIIAPGERKVLCPEQAKQLMKPGALAYGCIDFTVNNPVIAAMVVYDAKENPLTFLDDAPIIKATDNQLRGSFTGMNRLMTGAKEYRPGRDGVVYFYIGDGESDQFRSGIDATDGTIMTNTGNYGIIYNITIPCRRGGFRAYLAPRGGVYAGAVNIETDGGSGTPQLVETPKCSGWDFGVAGLPDSSFTDKKGNCLLTPEDEVTPLGYFEPKGELRLELSPPGASNLPIRIILVPDGLEPLASDAKRG
ncbi:MAG: hypothetical protein Q4D07_08165 [Selenomonadaceae bacterium]|nr:hypothetical protein [Selenomonadaceae bacterium]